MTPDGGSALKTAGEILQTEIRWEGKLTSARSLSCGPSDGMAQWYGTSLRTLNRAPSSTLWCGNTRAATVTAIARCSSATAKQSKRATAALESFLAIHHSAAMPVLPPVSARDPKPPPHTSRAEAIQRRADASRARAVRDTMPCGIPCRAGYHVPNAVITYGRP